ncbi:hypothetical protein [Actibacterium ureilyticum]|nr:hypothetical protein [Actibacterium ureilyticum]
MTTKRWMAWVLRESNKPVFLPWARANRAAVARPVAVNRTA